MTTELMRTESATTPASQPTGSASLIEYQTDSFGTTEAQVQNEFSYRPIPVLAPITLVVGMCSIIGIGSIVGLAVPLLGVILGLLAIRQIHGASGEYGGLRLTMVGFSLSALFLLAGSSLHAYTYATEVPEGYERLSFSWLAQQKPIIEDGKMRIHPDVRGMDGLKVFVKGYMYPEKAKFDLKRFILCKDTGQCCFGGKPAITDVIAVEFVNDVRGQFRELSLVNVAGTLRAKKPIVDESGEVVALYTLEAEYFK